MLSRAWARSSRVITSLLTRATISSTISLLDCAPSGSAVKSSGKISHLLGFMNFTRVCSLSFRFQGKQHVSDALRDPPPLFETHPQRAARIKAQAFAFGPNQADQFFRRQRSFRVKFHAHFVCFS